MIVEIYKTKPHPEVAQAEVELAESLGLRRQQWRVLKQDEENIYSILFPSQYKLADYKGHIPHEVLEVIEEAKALFPILTVRDTPDATEKDPVLIGRESEEWNATKYVLARWGEALAPMAEMKAKAAEIWRRRMGIALRNQLSVVQATIENLATLPVGFLPRDVSVRTVYTESFE